MRHLCDNDVNGHFGGCEEIVSEEVMAHIDLTHEHVKKAFVNKNCRGWLKQPSYSFFYSDHLKGA